MSKVVTTEIIEENKEPEKVEDKGAEFQAEKAEEKAEESKEQTEKAEEKAEEATEAAKAAEESKEKTEKMTSYNEFALKGLMDSVSLVVTRMELMAGIVKEMQVTFGEIIEELRTTTELQQDQIAQLDAAGTKVVTAAAALVKLHKEMTTTD
jgi:uncharacterized protein with von Willebrand factor type A (vWA) domain